MMSVCFADVHSPSLLHLCVDSWWFTAFGSLNNLLCVHRILFFRQRTTKNNINKNKKRQWNSQQAKAVWMHSCGDTSHGVGRKRSQTGDTPQSTRTLSGNKKEVAHCKFCQCLGAPNSIMHRQTCWIFSKFVHPRSHTTIFVPGENLCIEEMVSSIGLQTEMEREHNLLVCPVDERDICMSKFQIQSLGFIVFNLPQLWFCKCSECAQALFTWNNCRLIRSQKQNPGSHPELQHNVSEASQIYLHTCSKVSMALLKRDTKWGQRLTKTLPLIKQKLSTKFTMTRNEPVRGETLWFL